MVINVDVAKTQGASLRKVPFDYCNSDSRIFGLEYQKFVLDYFERKRVSEVEGLENVDEEF